MQKILLVDDDSEILMLVKEFLKEHEISVIFNDTGNNVIDQILLEEPDVVILDVNLVAKSGFDILRDIRSNPFTEFLPVIMLTGLKDENNQIEGLTSGADDYIIKPFDLNILHARLLAIFRRSLLTTRTKYDQRNLLNHLIGIYSRRHYQIFTKLNNLYESYPQGWLGFVPDLIIRKKNKLRLFLLESAQSILEENFIKRLEKIAGIHYQNLKTEANIIVRSKETYRHCHDIIKEYGFDIKIKLITKSTKPTKVPEE
jgi:CheY-like chemotaxis protein